MDFAIFRQIPNTTDCWICVSREPKRRIPEIQAQGLGAQSRRQNTSSALRNRRRMKELRRTQIIERIDHQHRGREWFPRVYHAIEAAPTVVVLQVPVETRDLLQFF